MKKFYLFISISLLIMIIVFTTFLLFVKNNKAIYIFSFEKSYSYILSDNKEIDFTLYLSSNKSSLTSYEYIKSVSLENEFNYVNLKLRGINSIEGSIVINRKTFYPFTYRFTLDNMILNDELLLEDAKINIIYEDSSNIEVKIGSVNFISLIQSDDDISITQLKGVMNMISNQDEMVGVVLRLGTYNNLIIKDIRILNPHISLDMNYLKILSNDISSYDLIDNILGFNYQHIGIGSSRSILINSETRYFIPLKYSSKLRNSSLTLIIEYEKNGENKFLYIDNYKFFDKFYLCENETTGLNIYKYELS